MGLRKGVGMIIQVEYGSISACGPVVALQLSSGMRVAL